MLKMSFIIEFVGVPDDYSYHEFCYRDVKRVFDQHGIDYSESEPGDTDYAYLAQEDNLSEEVCAEIRAHWRILGDDVTYRKRDFTWAQRIGIDGQEIKAMGVLNKRQFAALIDDLGAFAEDVQTLGTLGGPLSLGCVPDVSFRCESPCLIECIRVTPFPCNRAGEPLEGNEQTWDRLRGAMLAVFGC
jgi:hypothetical protein